MKRSQFWRFRMDSSKEAPTMGLDVLAVSYSGGDLLSAQLVFAEDRRVRTLECTHTFSDAARFLSEHPDAVILCEESAPEGTGANLISTLVSEANPAALITLKRGNPTAACVTVQIYRDHEALRVLFVDGDVLGSIRVAWQYCKETGQPAGAGEQQSGTLRPM
jgi:hypothetical protein